MNFEWDNEKNKKNIEKHGIDFADAVLVFDRSTLIYEDTREEYGERRFCGIGTLEETEIFVTYTLRKGNLRIISARRARKDEREKYRSIHSS